MNNCFIVVNLKFVINIKNFNFKQIKIYKIQTNFK